MVDAVTGTLGKYELKAVLGRGAMGTVYEAWDPVIARKVAIKTVRRVAMDAEDAPEPLDRFLREAQAAGQLSHPNIVSVFDYGETGELAYLVMELVPGATLKSKLDSGELLPPATVARVMTDVLDGLAYSHQHGIVHRDIKPANIMLTAEGRAKIADFGIARIERSTATQVGTVLGTPAYMSPEQLRGETVDARTDIYSAGVMLYQLLTGERPFEGGLTAVMHRALNSEPPKPSELSVSVPPAFDAVVARAMAKRPDDRFPTAEAFAEAIRAAMAAPGPLSLIGNDATVVTHTPAPPGPPARHGARWGVMAGGIAGALVLAGGVWYFAGHRTPPLMPSTPVRTVAPVAPATSPPPLPPVAPPAPLPEAAAPPIAAVRSAVADAIAPVACTLVGGDVTDPGRVVRLIGLADSAAEPRLRAAVAASAPGAALDWQVAPANARYCGALDMIRPIAPGFAAPDDGLALRFRGDQTLLHKNQVVAMEFAMPDFAAYLQVDYIQSDGSVLHMRQSVAAATRYAPHATATLTDPSWVVDAPYGQDMVVAVASAAPLFAAAREQAEQDSQAYLRALGAAIDALRARGGRLTGTARPLDTAP